MTRVEIEGGVNIPASQQLTGQCPQCGWTPPAQNQYRPNHFSEYVDEKGRIAVLSEVTDTVEVKDDDGKVVRTWKKLKNPQTEQKSYEELKAEMDQLKARFQEPAGYQTDVNKSVQPQLRVPAQVPQQTGNPSGNASVLPSKPLPPGLMKTAEEIAKTPKPTVAPLDLPTPTMSDKNAPVDLAPEKVTK